jgi:LytS/YehU family sensor histidine kinase
MLYEASATQVALTKEIQYIQNYLTLEKIRYADRVEINLNQRGQLSSYQIAPMLLLPFVENSFKHGVSGEIEKAWVSIDLSVKDNWLTYKVENTKSNDKGYAKRDYAEGIGLKNLQRRLEIIYPNRHELKIFAEESTYLAILKVQLESPLTPEGGNMGGKVFNMKEPVS